MRRFIMSDIKALTLLQDLAKNEKEKYETFWRKYKFLFSILLAVCLFTPSEVIFIQLKSLTFIQLWTPFLKSHYLFQALFIIFI